MDKIAASAAILTGGKSKRFGQDKTFLRLNDHQVSIQVYHLLKGIFSQVFFVSGPEKKEFIEDAVVFPDLWPDIGPLGGLATALNYAEYPFCFLTGCDLPFITGDLIKILWQQADSFDIIVPTWRGNSEPLVCFYHKRCLNAINIAIESGTFMLKGFWQELNINYVDMLTFYSESEVKQIFLNINTPEDYRRALRMIKNIKPE